MYGNDSDSESDELGLESIQYRPQPKENPNEKLGKKIDKKPNKKDVEVKEPPSKQIVRKVEKQSKEIVTEEESIKKRRIILMLHFYMLEFPDELKSFKKTNFEKKSYDELIEMQKEMDFVLGNNSGIANAVKMFKYGLSTLEMLTVNFSPINCTGITELICNDPDAMKDVKLIALKNCRLMQTEPEYRLAYKILMGGMALHSMNPTIAQNSEGINNINSQFQDI